jgi:uncharacterized membrane-anchored protein
MDGKDHAMNRSPKFIIAALAFPILALLGLAINKATIREIGRIVTFKITGYDPRDLLSGHYLIYQIDYGVPGLCTNPDVQGQTFYLCPQEQRVSGDKPASCSYFIKGSCQNRRFEAGVERYYIPQEYAVRLDRLVQNKQGSVTLSVASNGEAQVNLLLIEGLPWAEFIQKNQEPPAP